MMNPSLYPFLELAQDLRQSSASKDFATLGTLLSDHLSPQAIDALVYIRSTIGTITLIGSHADYWPRESSPLALAREPSLLEFAQVLQSVRKEA